MFYTYHQNNSFGIDVHNDDVTKVVIVEADSPYEADEIAEARGLYFDGIANGQDCPCCGDRWYRAPDKGSEMPEVYGDPPEGYTGFPADRVAAGEPWCYVYHKDGRKVTYTR